MKKIKVIIADDHDLFRDGLKMQLNASGEIEVIAEARNGAELVRTVNEYAPDVVVTDLMMPGVNGIEAIREIYPSGFTRIIAISTFDSEHLVMEALEAGAMGYVLKNADRGENVEAVKTVFNYQNYYCPSISAKLGKLISKSRPRPGIKKNHDLFSEREKEIIILVCMGKSSEDIGAILFMGARTVEGIRRRISQKMQVKSLAEFIVYAIRYGIYEVNDEGNFTMNE